MLRKQSLAVVCLIVVAVLASCLTASASMRVRTFVQDGQSIDEVTIDGRPPDNYRAPVVALPQTDAASGVVVLNNVPAFDWCYGCSATSAAMMMGYYDNNGYPNMYTGPANGGVCPLTNSTWGYGQCPLSATHQGIDGRNLLGHVDDYWRATNNCDPDPYVGNWTEHTQGDCTGDFMGTNQSKYANCDGATTFYFNPSGAALNDYIAPSGMLDGCHGMKMFVQSRGYSVTANFSQYIVGYNGNTTGFSFANYMSEIDAGRPVLIQVTNHTMLGYGYDSSTQTIYIHDTWDHNNHSMTWGGSYSGLSHYGVTVLRLACTGANPVITGQPTGGAYCTGQSVVFGVTATGGPLQYQWRKGGSNIAGANSSTYTIGSVAAGDAGNYDCVVTNACGSTTSNTAVLVVNTPPSITANPTDQTVFSGNAATFSVSATGAGLAYRWQVSTDGGASYTNVTTGTGGTTASYTTPPTVITDDGRKYRCIVSGTCSPAATSAAAALSVETPVVLLSEGFESTFVNGAPPGWSKEYVAASVDWTRSTGDHSGGSAQQGSYNALLYSSSTTNHTTYLITPAIAFAGCGAIATLEFWHKQAASGSKQDTLDVYYKTASDGAWAPIASYPSAVTDWTKRTIVLPNVTSTYYIGFLGNAKGGNGVCLDNVVVTQGCCPPVITSQPSPVDTCTGGTASFSVSADGVGLTYQWRKNGSNIFGATGPMFTINPVGAGDAGQYDCVVSNGCSSATSNAAALAVRTGPSISGQPADAAIWTGGPVTLSVTANGSGTLRYQWRQGGVDIAGATGATYSIPSAGMADDGSYDCVVTDDCGSAVSTAATVAVVAPSATIATAKLIPDGQLVALVGKPISLARTGYFYVEEPNLSSGIRIERIGHGLSAGSRANLAGTIYTNVDGERYIAASAAVADGPGSVSALAMGNAAVCGKDWQYGGATGQRGAYGLVGLNNVGLLVRTWGTFNKTSATTFILDDGSGFPVTCIVEPGTYLSYSWQYATATGVSSISKLSEGVYWPQLLVTEVRVY